MVRKNIKIVNVTPTEEVKEEVVIEQDTSPEEEPVKPEPVKPLKERKNKAIPNVVVPPPSLPTPVKYQDEKVVCSLCNKTMSAKSLKYSHDKNCKCKVKPPTEQPTKLSQEIRERPESFFVDFSDPFVRAYEAKQTRADKIQLLVAQSLNKNKKYMLIYK